MVNQPRRCAPGGLSQPVAGATFCRIKDAGGLTTGIFSFVSLLLSWTLHPSRDGALVGGIRSRRSS
jgi:hypothetical protein